MRTALFKLTFLKPFKICFIIVRVMVRESDWTDNGKKLGIQLILHSVQLTLYTILLSFGEYSRGLEDSLAYMHALHKHKGFGTHQFHSIIDINWTYSNCNFFICHCIWLCLTNVHSTFTITRKMITNTYIICLNGSHKNIITFFNELCNYVYCGFCWLKLCLVSLVFIQVVFNLTHLNNHS